ncbi:IDEAL domain-containing protein [Paenibacillus hemerocallicola]|uniref:IDEAL domain-containing protein n=2 Tax=Paenibacillus hemerocallicola TaxID=1172614 RepID=A0A5C4T4A4_9BACL|nr:IDEAL domain-containing protein [Paenibacillus hemerocallicola]TNJ63580.1 IDEAL domain-containing protein [Paenibacillus hemerocallicola]
MEKMDVSGYAAMLGLFAEMVLDDAIRKQKEQTLYREIDSALARGDEKSFIVLTEQWKELHS